jgi:GDP-L-fucose synthase
MTTPKKIYVADHRGMVSAAIVRALQAQAPSQGQVHIVTRTHAELDLINQAAVQDLAEAKRIALLKKHGYQVNLSVE